MMVLGCTPYVIQAERPVTMWKIQPIWSVNQWPIIINQMETKKRNMNTGTVSS
jgi:hypothetical protein